MNKALVEKELHDKIELMVLLKQTSCSVLYYLKGTKEYVLKNSRTKDINEEFNNHKEVYDCWFENRHTLEFRVPELYCLAADGSFYVMEYINDGLNLLDILLGNRPDTQEIFRRAGLCLNQYHRLMTDCVADKKQSILSHDTVSQLLTVRKGERVRQCLASFPTESYRIIFKDFTPTNVVVDAENRIYFLDFQKIYYYAPFYYDLARLIDTAHVFALVRRPRYYLSNIGRIRRVLECFLEGYGEPVEAKWLAEMQWLHRAEHVQMKANKDKFGSIVLRLIYCLI